MELSFLNFLQSLHHPLIDALMVFFTKLGNGAMVWLMFAGYFYFYKKDKKMATQILVGLLMTVLIGAFILKPIFMRARPFNFLENITLLIKAPIDYSFPSGHTATSVVCSYLISCRYKKLRIVVIPLAVLIAFSRMYIGVHYPTDILGGVVLGIVCGMVIRKYSKS